MLNKEIITQEIARLEKLGISAKNLITGFQTCPHCGRTSKTMLDSNSKEEIIVCSIQIATSSGWMTKYRWFNKTQNRFEGAWQTEAEFFPDE